MKGYYVHFDQRKLIGVSKKIDMQMDSFSKEFNIEEINIIPNSKSTISKFFWTLPFSYVRRDYKSYLQKIVNPDFIYIRRSIADLGYIRFLKSIKRQYPKCIILVELYTYPYDRDEFLRKNTWTMFYKEIFYRRQYKKIVDRFITYTNDDYIFGVPTLKTMNGIDFSKVSIKNCDNETTVLRIISVAYLQKQHAYDRLIEGIGQYYMNSGSMKIKYYIVGIGPELNRYKELVTKYNIQDNVIFCGQKSGKELDDLYDSCDIGAAFFGTYRTGIKVTSALKTREYLAKGLPMVYSGIVDVIGEDFPYVAIVPDNDNPIDIEPIIQLFNKVKFNKQNIAKYIRDYGEKTVSMDKTMKVVFDYIKENC